MADDAIHFGDGVIPHAAVKSGVARTPSPTCRGGIRQALAFTIPDSPPSPYGVWVESVSSVGTVLDAGDFIIVVFLL